MTNDNALAGAVWRKSTYSGGGGTGGGNCVEVAVLRDGRIALRDSKNPGNGVILFSRVEMGAWIKGVKAGA